VALSGRNINAPKFKSPGGLADYKLDSQYRAGLAIRPFNPWVIALDLDLTENPTSLDNYDSRQLALGTEINLLNKKRFNIPLRAGIMKNLAQSDEDLMFTAGIGFMTAYFNLELAGAFSAGTDNVDGNKVPGQAGAALSLSLLF
jgi:hypothetical protein